MVIGKTRRRGDVGLKTVSHAFYQALLAKFRSALLAAPGNPVAFAGNFMVPRNQGPILQWIIAGGLGLGLGGYVLVVSSLLPLQKAPLLVLAALLPLILMIVAMIVKDLQKILLAVIILDIPFQLDFNLYYQREFAAIGAEGGLTISVTLFCLVALYALWLSELLVRAAPLPRPWFRLSLPFVTYFVLVMLSVIVARNVLLSVFEIFLLLQMLLLWIYIVATTRTRQDVLFIVTLLLIGLALESLVMIMVGITGSSIDFKVVSAVYDRGRVGGTFGSPIIAAGFLYLLLAPALSILLTRLNRYYKWLAVFAFALGGLALLLTFSRGGWIAFFFSTGALCLLAWRRGWLTSALPIIFAILVVLLGVFYQDAILSRIFGDDNGSAAARGPLMQLAFNMIRDNPLGVGANNFAVRLMEYAILDTAGVWLYTVHNKYLLIWAETGLAGLGAFIWLLLTTIHRGWQCWRFNDRFLSPLAIAFTLAIIGHMIHMLVDVFHSRPTVQLLWLIAGLVTAMYSIAREEGSLISERNI